MNRIFIYIVFSAFIAVACSQQEDSAVPVSESEAQKDSNEEVQEAPALDKYEVLHWEDEKMIGGLEQDEMALEIQQIAVKDKFVKQFAKQKLEEFFDLWQIYVDSENQASMKEVAREELDKLISPALWTQMQQIPFTHKKELSKIKLETLSEEGAFYLVNFSFKLNEQKLSAQALVSFEESEWGKQWRFKLSTLE